MNKIFHLLIKPVSSLCDINCTYCFYKDIAKNRAVYSYGLMKKETYEKLIKNVFQITSEEVVFMFQGGEPLLWGLNNFKAFTDCVRFYNKKNLIIKYAIQTNGINITADIASFFKKHNFLVGISIDGRQQDHDKFRLNLKNQGTFMLVMHAISLLNKYEVDYNIITVVTKHNAYKAKEIYNFFKLNGFKFMQFIPCLNPINNMANNFCFTLTPKDYTQFLKDLFDVWSTDFFNNKIYSIRVFENYLAILLGLPVESCDMAGMCSIQNVIESDGSVYPCDFYVLDTYKVGNILYEDLQTIMHKNICQKFIKESLPLPQECQHCQYLILCKNGCKRLRQQLKIGYGKNFFCEVYKDFFSYTLPRFIKIARIIQSQE